jgi:predicted dinucleotide-binding enzyme
MRIGIIGSGVVGRALARGWAQHGHETRIGSRRTDDPELGELGVAPPAEVASWGDLVVLAVAGDAAVDIATDLADVLADKVVIDATNPLESSPSGPTLFVGFDDSLGERVQRAAPGALVVKAYNTVGNALMVDPQLPDGTPVMFIGGNDDRAKAVVAGLLSETGWEPADVGDITAARLLEPLALLWIAYGIRTGTWTHALTLARASE